MITHHNVYEGTGNEFYSYKLMIDLVFYSWIFTACGVNSTHLRSRFPVHVTRPEDGLSIAGRSRPFNNFLVLFFLSIIQDNGDDDQGMSGEMGCYFRDGKRTIGKIIRIPWTIDARRWLEKITFDFDFLRLCPCVPRRRKPIRRRPSKAEDIYGQLEEV